MEELQVDFVSAAALLTLFAADLERRRTGCIAAISSLASTLNAVKPRISSLFFAMSTFIKPRGSDTVLVRSTSAIGNFASR